VEVQSLEHEQREEEPALLAGDQADDPAGLGRILFEERDGVDLDVGVAAHHVRVAVMLGVLGVPPGVAHADGTGEDPREAEVRRPGRQDLAMRRLVGEEGDLREDDAERARDEQLEPAVSEQDETGDRASEGENDAGGDEAVEAGRALQQPHLTDDLRDVLIRLGHRGEVGVAGIRLTYAAESAGGLFDLCNGDVALLSIGALEL
jgi:hypothetical protein